MRVRVRVRVRAGARVRVRVMVRVRPLSAAPIQFNRIKSKRQSRVYVSGIAFDTVARICTAIPC